MAKRGLPSGIGLRHDAHYVEELARTHRTIGRMLPLEQIEPNPEQPRIEIGDLAELSASIKEKGVLEPLLVKPMRQNGKWMIIAGERRWRAAGLAGLKEVPCIELDIDEQGVAEIALIENLQRKDLTIWEEADGLSALAERFKYTHDQIAKKISKSRTTVTEFITIANLPESIREKCVRSKINAKSALLEIARQFDEAAMHRFVDDLHGQTASREAIRRKARPQEHEPAAGKRIPPAGNTSVPTNERPDEMPRTGNLKTSFNNENIDRSYDYRTSDGLAHVRVRFESGSFTKAELKAALEEALRAADEY